MQGVGFRVWVVGCGGGRVLHLRVYGRLQLLRIYGRVLRIYVLVLLRVDGRLQLLPIYVLGRHAQRWVILPRERIVIELMTSGRQLKA